MTQKNDSRFRGIWERHEDEIVKSVGQDSLIPTYPILWIASPKDFLDKVHWISSVQTDLPSDLVDALLIAAKCEFGPSGVEFRVWIQEDEEDTLGLRWNNLDIFSLVVGTK